MEMRCVLRAGPAQGLDPSNPIVIPDDNSMEEETQSNCLPATANSTAMQENNWIEQFPSRSDSPFDSFQDWIKIQEKEWLNDHNHSLSMIEGKKCYCTICNT